MKVQRRNGRTAERAFCSADTKGQYFYAEVTSVLKRAEFHMFNIQSCIVDVTKSGFFEPNFSQQAPPRPTMHRKQPLIFFRLHA